MSNGIFHCCMKQMDKDSIHIVPRVAVCLQARGDVAASLTVMELGLGCGDFKVAAGGVYLFKNKTLKEMTG